MSSWLIYALLSALCAAFVSIFGKVGLTGLDSSAATAVRAAIMALFLMGVVVAEGHTADLPQVFADKKALAFVALSGIAGALSWLFYFMALKEGEVTQVAPIDKLSVVFAVVLAVVIFGEKVSLAHGIAIAMIAAGGLLLAIFPDMESPRTSIVDVRGGWVTRRFREFSYRPAQGGRQFHRYGLRGSRQMPWASTDPAPVFGRTE